MKTLTLACAFFAASGRAFADRAGKKLVSFGSAAEFLKAAAGVDRKTPVYVDADLVAGERGDLVSERIRDLGFVEIYLATGHSPDKFSGLPHLRGVIGKEPPWQG